LITVAPRDKRRFAVARPIPEEPPVYAHVRREMVEGGFPRHTGHKDDFTLDSLQVCIVDSDFGHSIYETEWKSGMEVEMAKQKGKETRKGRSQIYTTLCGEGSS
jgi:hypothetical protein